jgi:MYXO-CTERM domain-containing protein
MTRGIQFGPTHAALGALLLIAASAEPVRAGIIWDYSPDTTGASVAGTTWANKASGQNFAERISFVNPVLVTGMDIYTRANIPSVGQSATIRIRADAAGIPGVLLEDFVEQISIVDTVGATSTNRVRAHVDFTTPVLLAGLTDFWIGMSGTNSELGQSGLVGVQAPDDSRMYFFSGTNPASFTNTLVGDMAFRLFGEEQSTATPEPASLAIWGLGAVGIAVLGAIRSRRQKRARLAGRDWESGS